MAIDELMWKSWVEVFFIVLLLLGFFLAISLPSPFLTYLVIFLAGLLVGREIYLKKGKKPLVRFILIILGFIFGYMLGSKIYNVNVKLVTLLFIVAAITSYYLHKKEYINF